MPASSGRSFSGQAGYEGQARSEALKVAHDAHFARVMHEKRPGRTGGWLGMHRVFFLSWNDLAIEIVDLPIKNGDVP